MWPVIEALQQMLMSGLRHYSIPITETNSFVALVVSTYLVLVIGACIMYLVLAGGSFLFFFCWRSHFFPVSLRNTDTNALSRQIKNEVCLSLKAIPVIGLFTAPLSLAAHLGYSRLYHDISDFGVLYLIFSVFLFLLVTDTMIYWIHRILHIPVFYVHLHKSHHRYQYTTPFSAYAFHPVDAVLQTLPYYLFIFMFPFHENLFWTVFLAINFWTISIHDQVDFCGGGLLNSTGHHTLHHSQFNFNYGQYFTIWDRLCSTYKAAEKTHSFTDLLK